MNKKELKEIINNKLKWVNLSINDNELDEIIKLYEHYLDLLLEATYSDKQNYQDRYGFIYEDDDEVYEMYKNIFYNLTLIKKENIECCLDYLQLFNSLHGPIYNIVNTLYHYTNSISSICTWVNRFNNKQSDLINYFYNMNERLITVWLDDFLIDCVKESSYVTNEYKKIIDLYWVLNKKSNSNKELNKYTITYEVIINVSYYYFLVNNYFNTEPDKVISFLQSIIDNPIELLDKVNIMGIPTKFELYDYLDKEYHNINSKQKVLK